MADNRLIKIVGRLREKTIRGELIWEATFDEGVFSLSFSNYSILISLKPTKAAEIPPDVEDLVLTIVNNEGITIEEVRDIDFDKDDFDGEVPFMVMNDIYKNARRSAMGIDEAINSILAELET